ncbi:OsmC family protein [Marichromatium gracile]|uniref:Putative redox protein n=1 Tax=Marichromatium gracile TaxID=1048 RepID=A0A4R4ADY7_MARGR|nr:OsmC family protein [Marichromatium gracile]MBK1709006.1 peroxiredoxin [Marichromatium gracile]TCW36866.1 putative redox protein [Marichromatium gracile]
MKARVKWLEGAAMVGMAGDAGSEHSVVMDGPPQYGGRNLGPRPMELLLIGMGGCTQFDVMQILRKARQQVSDCVVELTAERAERDPKVFTRIHAHFIVSGQGLDPKRVERAIALSAEKYCSASIMLGATAEITHDFELRDTAVSVADAPPR